MRHPRFFLFVAVCLAVGASVPTPATASPRTTAARDEPSTTAVAVATGALALLSPVSAFASALAVLDHALEEADGLLLRARQTAAFVRSGQIACPVPGFTEVVDNFGEWRGSHRHTGVDIRAPHSVPVRAVLPAVVIEPSDADAYGMTVHLRDLAGNVWLYAHLSSVIVQPGSSVIAGQVLGAVGCTGRCTGPHLHIEQRPAGGAAIDPFQRLVKACVTSS